MGIKKFVNSNLRKFGYQFSSIEKVRGLEKTSLQYRKLKKQTARVVKKEDTFETKDRYVERIVEKKITTTPFESNERFEVLKNIGFTPNTIMDCGAFIGKWAKYVNELYPSSKLILVEPNLNLNERIDEHTKSFKDKIYLFNVAVADKEGTATLNIWDQSKHSNPTTALAASSLMGHVQGEASTKLEVPIKTIDSLAKEAGATPDLLKLDLQGAELPALKGALKTLETAEMCVIEFGCLDAYIDRTIPTELMTFMGEQDYVLYDIWDLRYRPYDNAMAGGDFVFVKKNSKLREHKDYF